MRETRVSRRRLLTAVAAAATTGLSGCGSEDATPTSGDPIVTESETPTATPTAGPSTGTPTATRTDTAEPTDTPTETSTATPTPDPASFAEWPTFMRNEFNWGHHPEADGPHDEVSVAWERDLDASEVNATPTLAGGTLYVGDGSPVADSGTAYALDPLTGETQWSESFDGPVLEGPTVAGDVVYVAAGGRIAGFREDGSLVWDFENDAAENYTAVTREGDDIYYGADSGRLYRFAALSKLKKWDPRLFGAISAAPIVEDGTVYVSARDGTVQARSSGSEPDWSRDFGDSVNGLAKRDGRLYAPSEEGRLIQLNERGNTVWSQSTPGAATATPAVTEETAYVGTRRNTVVAYSTDDGFEKWRFTDAEDGFTAPPVVADGTVYVGCQDNRVYALDAETGEREWTFETGDNIEQAAPVVAGGFVFIGSQDGTLYALSD